MSSAPEERTFLASYQRLFDLVLNKPVFGLPHSEKQQLLLELLKLQSHHHQGHCGAYKNIFPNDLAIDDLNTVPFLAVRLFKHLELLSVEPSEVFKTLQSSGTSGQAPAKIFLDRETSARQSKVLVKIMQEFIGKQRLPMLIIDSPDVLKDRQLFSARGAGIQGLAFFGRDHTYALDGSMQPNWKRIDAFVEKYQGQPVLVFGFTFMVWLYFIQKLEQKGKKLALPHGILLHSGGWKKLETLKVDNQQFKQSIQAFTGIPKVHNFYGMAEQVGSVFVECEHGKLHSPMFADVIVRDPITLNPCSNGKEGLVQVLSSLPTSYPGHSLLTEDLGTIHGEDDCPCGRKGKYFTIAGRLPKTEVRGCSDTHSGGPV